MSVFGAKENTSVKQISPSEGWSKEPGSHAGDPDQFPVPGNSSIWSPEHDWAVRAGILTWVCTALSLAGAALVGVQGLRLLWGHPCTVHCASGVWSCLLIHSLPLPRLFWVPADTGPGTQAHALCPAAPPPLQSHVGLTLSFCFFSVRPWAVGW